MQKRTNLQVFWTGNTQHNREKELCGIGTGERHIRWLWVISQNILSGGIQSFRFGLGQLWRRHYQFRTSSGEKKKLFLVFKFSPPPEIRCVLLSEIMSAFRRRHADSSAGLLTAQQLQPGTSLSCHSTLSCQDLQTSSSTFHWIMGFLKVFHHSLWFRNCFKSFCWRNPCSVSVPNELFQRFELAISSRVRQNDVFQMSNQEFMH